jgi:hypothetical protein
MPELADSSLQITHNHNLTTMTNKTKFTLLVVATVFVFTSCKNWPGSLVDAITGATLSMSADGNSLFHQSDEKKLDISEIEIRGEIGNPGNIDLDKFYKREVFIKETMLNSDNEQQFIGAFRYKGYSLFDLLHPYKVDKKNAELFRPAIDLYVIIENDKGESVSFSWSEIFHTHNPHQILIATEVAPIKPYRKEVDYETGDTWKVVAANDLYSNRILENPVSITIRSFDAREYPINRDLDPVFSPEISVMVESQSLLTIPQIKDPSKLVRYHSTFYGMGMGYHDTRYFDGIPLHSLLKDSMNLFDGKWIQNGLVCFASVDGYRAIFSYSELFNRQDQTAPILSIPGNPEEGGYYRIFIQSDFYADRSVKALKEIYFFRE